MKMQNLSVAHNCPEKYHLEELGFDYAYNATLQNVMDFIAGEASSKGTVFFRTSTPDHFQNGEWHSGGTCKQTEPVSDEEIEVKDVHKILRNVEVGQFERAVSEEDGRLKLLDFTGMLLTRPDPTGIRVLTDSSGRLIKTKTQRYRAIVCIGPIDYLNDVILETIVSG